jgi:hypothetical protein
VTRELSAGSDQFLRNLVEYSSARGLGASLQSEVTDRFILDPRENSWGVNIRVFNQLRPVSHLLETVACLQSYLELLLAIVLLFLRRELKAKDEIASAPALRPFVLRPFDFAQDRRAVQDWFHYLAKAKERQRDHIRAQILRLRANGIIIAAGSRSYRVWDSFS